MQRKSSFNSSHIMYRSEELVSAASNRYRITVQVANRAKRRRYEELENFDDPTMKPVILLLLLMLTGLMAEDDECNEYKY